MIYLIRHTEPEIEKGVCYGQSDIDVKNSFLLEANKVLSKINISSKTKIISSPLRRCSKLANFISSNQEIKIDNRLKELNFGLWELVPWKEINQDDLKKWGDNYLHVSPPEGESFNDLHKRTKLFWNELNFNKHDYVICTHDGVIKSLLVSLLEMPLRKAFSIKIKYADVVKINVIDAQNCNIEFL